MRIAYYISSHGFGHISRSYEVIKRLLSKDSISKIYVISKRNYFIKDTHEKLVFIDKQFSPGLIQKTSLDIDYISSIKALQNFYSKKEELLEEEVHFLKTNKIDRIISDADSFPFYCAIKTRIPSIFIGNFTWDFIYKGFIKYHSDYQSIAEFFAEFYSHCSKGLILPFNCPISSIQKLTYIPLVGRTSLKDKNTARREFGFTDDKKYILFSFGAYGLSETLFNFNLLDPSCILVTSGYDGLFHESVMHLDKAYYPDVLKACDYVLTKPGYGILSEAYNCQTPILYTSRGDFPEYYLVKALKTYFKARYIENEDVYNFRFPIKEMEQTTFKTAHTLPEGNPYQIIYEALL